jgi:hypothetical protein
MRTKDKIHLNVSIVQTVDEGIVNDPEVFATMIDAQCAFEAWVVSKGFRKWNHNTKLPETFKGYQKAFSDWEDSPNCPYDKMDWEIHIWL